MYAMLCMNAGVLSNLCIGHISDVLPALGTLHLIVAISIQHLCLEISNERVN